MTTVTWLILSHQILFQAMYVAKNYILRRKLHQPIRGFNSEANLFIGFFVVYIVLTLFQSLDTKEHLVAGFWTLTSLVVAILLMFASLCIAAISLRDLGDSWRVGVIEEQKTKLIDRGIYRFSRNPYFLSYLLMITSYALLLQNAVHLGLSLVGCGLIHAMVKREEKYLLGKHNEAYIEYQGRVPRYFLLRS